MTRSDAGAVACQVEGLFEVGTATGLDEAELLDRFARKGDGIALEAIVLRHGPMVWSVCRRALCDPNDAKEAIQATFLQVHTHG